MADIWHAIDMESSHRKAMGMNRMNGDLEVIYFFNLSICNSHKHAVILGNNNILYVL